MAEIYCGIGKIPKRQRRGNMKECAEKGQVRYYGIKKIDTKTLEASKNKDSIPETREKLILEISRQKGTVNRFKGRYEKAPKSIDQQTKDEYYKKWQDAEKKLKLLIPKFKKLEAQREKEKEVMEKEKKQEKKQKGSIKKKTPLKGKKTNAPSTVGVKKTAKKQKKTK